MPSSSMNARDAGRLPRRAEVTGTLEVQRCSATATWRPRGPQTRTRPRRCRRYRTCNGAKPEKLPSAPRTGAPPPSGREPWGTRGAAPNPGTRAARSLGDPQSVSARRGPGRPPRERSRRGHGQEPQAPLMQRPAHQLTTQYYYSPMLNCRIPF